MDDDLKPRRPLWEEEAEIQDHIGYCAFQDPPFYELVRAREEDEEAALVGREQAETTWERAESERILQAEAEMKADIRVRRQRELRRTFAQPRQAAAANP